MDPRGPREPIVDAFDSDVLIYAVRPEDVLGRRVLALLPAPPLSPEDPPAGIGSVLLLPEVLGKPIRLGATTEATALLDVLARLELHPVDRATGRLAATLSAKYKLKAIDATHLATAVAMGADRFITNNRKDFTKEITEVDVVYPEELPAG